MFFHMKNIFKKKPIDNFWCAICKYFAAMEALCNRIAFFFIPHASYKMLCVRSEITISFAHKVYFNGALSDKNHSAYFYFVLRLPMKIESLIINIICAWMADFTRWCRG
jgi:hypothetical protein